MNRIFAILCAICTASAACAIVRHETTAARDQVLGLRARQSDAIERLAEIRNGRSQWQKLISEQQTRRNQLARDWLDPELREWLLAGHYGQISARLTPKLATALRLQWNDPTNYILVSKSTLPSLVVGLSTNMLNENICSLLAITPDERSQIESACGQTRADFTDWAEANLQIKHNSGLPEFTIPPSPELSRTLSNNLYSAIQDTIGPERTPLLWGHEQEWFRENLGDFASVTNTLSLDTNTTPGQSGYSYADWPRGHGGPIATEPMIGTFQNIFPGGWKDLLKHEGLEEPTNH